MDVHSGQMVQTVRRKTRRAFHTAGLSTANAILKIGKMAKQPFTLADTAFQSYAKQKNASRGNTGIPASDQDETESTLSSVDDPTESEQLIFGTLPQFFRSKTFNAELYELERVVPSKETDEKMAAQEEEAYCDQILAERKEQLQVVDKMLERKISKNYAAIVEGILQISRVNNGLQSVILSCERSRSLLHSVKTSYVKRSMSVAQLFRRQEHLKQVQDLLVRLNFIVEQDHVYQQLLKQRKFVEAVQLCDQIQFDEQIRSLSAITPLVSTWMTRKRDSSGVLTKIEETLVQCCYRIQEESFENCVNALYSLGEAHTAAIRITRAVKKVMEKCAVQVLVTFTSNMESKGIELAMRSVPPDEIRRCVAAVLTEMSKFFCNYQQLIHWFDRHLSIPASTMSPPVVLNLASTTHNTSHGATLETDHSQYVTQYIDYLREIRRVLVKERRTSCLHAIGNVIEMLQGTTSVTTKPIDMLWCTTAVQAFIRMCAVLENDMSSLSSVKNIARNFVRNNLHRPYMDSLISVMQNDTFHPMAGLQLEHLQLWRPLKRVGLETMYNLAVTYIQQRNADLDPEVFSVDYNYSALESSLGREPVSATHSDAIFVLSSHEVCRKMTKYIEEIVDPCPFLTNDTIDMLEEHIASYFYFVFSNMTHVTQSDRHSTYLVEEDGEIPQEQRILLGELKESTVRACSEAVTRHVPLNSQLILRMRSPKDIFAAPERTAALHSLSTVVDHLEKTCTTLEEFLSASQIKAHKALIARLRKCIAVMFRECTRRLAAALIPVHHCFHAIEKVKWNEFKSVGMFTEPSMYVKGIIDTVRAVFDRFKIYHKDFPDSASKDLLLRFVVLHIFSNLIEFYSRIKKCGEQGRSVMKFDVESISNQLKSLLGVAIVPNSHCVTNYIDGFGLSAEELFAWVQDWHHLYSTTQLLALVSYGHGVEGRTRDRQTVLAMLRELLVSLNHVDKTIFDVLA